jgi:hypothetical protein
MCFLKGILKFPFFLMNHRRVWSHNHIFFTSQHSSLPLFFHAKKNTNDDDDNNNNNKHALLVIVLKLIFSFSRWCFNLQQQSRSWLSSDDDDDEQKYLYADKKTKNSFRD